MLGLGDMTKRASRRASMRRGSISALPTKTHEIPWDVLERLLLPCFFCHAAAIVLSTILNTLEISHASTFAIFIWFAVSTVGAVCFYHFVKVSSSGKGVLITGCETPLGWYLAKKLDDIGFTVYAGFATELEDNDEAQILKEETSGRMKVLHIDITDESSMVKAALFVSQHLPYAADGLWAVVHTSNWVALGEVEWVPFAVFRRSLDMNLLGAARLTQILLPLIRRAQGRVVFLTSGLNRVPAPVRGIQNATQAAIEALASSLRQELRPRGVDVCIVGAGEYQPGNSWLQESDLRDEAKKMWNQMSEEQKKTYGEDYYEAAMTSVEKSYRTIADIQPAIRVLIDSVCRTFPMARYTALTIPERIQMFVAEHLPYTMYEIIYQRNKI